MRPLTVRPRTIVVIAAAAALLGAGARGLLTRSTPTRSTGDAVGVSGPRRDDVVPAGFARSRDGAVAAATSDVRQGQRLFDLTGGARVDALQTMAAREAADAFVAQETQRLTDLDDVATRARGPLTWDVAVLASRLDAFTERRARVSVWRVGILSAAGLTAPLAEWTTVAYELVWERGDWRVWSETQTPGPTPLGHPSQPPSTPEQLRSALAGFTRFPGPDPL